MAKSHFTFRLEVEFDNTRVNTTDELPTELARVSETVEMALRSRLSKGYQGSVTVTSAGVEPS